MIAVVEQPNNLPEIVFGILLASQLVDDLVYNEKHNEVLFVKYIS